MEKINWEKIRAEFEKEMALKLQGLPDHREVPENLKELRHLISHQLPETASAQVFKQLINLLLEGKPVDLQEIKTKYLNPQLEKEKQTLNKFENEFKGLGQSAMKWIKTNLSEEELKLLWKEHNMVGHLWLDTWKVY